MRKKKRSGIGPFTVIVVVAILGTAGFYTGCWAQRYFNISSEKIIGVHEDNGNRKTISIPLNNSSDIIIKH